MLARASDGFNEVGGAPFARKVRKSAKNGAEKSPRIGRSQIGNVGAEKVRKTGRESPIFQRLTRAIVREKVPDGFNGVGRLQGTKTRPIKVRWADKVRFFFKKFKPKVRRRSFKMLQNGRKSPRNGPEKSDRQRRASRGQKAQFFFEVFKKFKPNQKSVALRFKMDAVCCRVGQGSWHRNSSKRVGNSR